MQSKTDDSEAWLLAFDPTVSAQGTQPEASFVSPDQANFLNSPSPLLGTSSDLTVWKSSAAIQPFPISVWQAEQPVTQSCSATNGRLESWSGDVTAQDYQESALQCARGPSPVVVFDWTYNSQPTMDTQKNQTFEPSIAANSQQCEESANDDSERKQSTQSLSEHRLCMFPSCLFRLDFDNSQMLRHHYEQNHPEIRMCHAKGCVFIAGSMTELEFHARGLPTLEAHRPFKCPTYGCTFHAMLLDHLICHHTEEHTNRAKSRSWKCQQCGYSTNRRYVLELHASETGHACFFCPFDGCLSTFSRADVLERHKILHSAAAIRYPCKYCKKYRGQNGFKRKDHLTQHIRNYHHIGDDDQRFSYRSGASCPHSDCAAFRADAFDAASVLRHVGLEPSLRFIQHAFPKMSDYTAHMKKVHDESPFPCPEPGCLRKGGKGYFRKLDLIKHQKKEHAANEGADGEE